VDFLPAGASSWLRPTAAIIESQSVKSAEKGGLSITPQGSRRAKRSREKEAADPWGRTRIAASHLVHSAGIQERDGGILVMATPFQAASVLVEAL